MKRMMTMVAALGVIVAACGGGDSESATTTDPAVTTTEPAAQTDEDTAESTEDTAESTEDTAESSTDETGADESTGEAAGDDLVELDVDDDRDGDANGPQISSLDDIPRECRDLLGDFLREIEPLVSDFDWETASLNDFEAIGEEFEVKSDEFDLRGEAEGCNDLDFVGDSEFDLMIEFAGDEAPGTVGFLEFLANLGAVGGTDDGESAGAEGIESCDDGIEFIQDLIDNYDTFADAPASELLRFQQLSLVFTTCTPEQLAFFESPEVTAFLGG